MSPSNHWKVFVTIRFIRKIQLSIFPHRVHTVLTRKVWLEEAMPQRGERLQKRYANGFSGQQGNEWSALLPLLCTVGPIGLLWGEECITKDSWRFNHICDRAHGISYFCVFVSIDLKGRKGERESEWERKSEWEREMESFPIYCLLPKCESSGIRGLEHSLSLPHWRQWSKDLSHPLPPARMCSKLASRGSQCPR